MGEGICFGSVPMSGFERPPANLCAECGAELIAPMWAEHLDERNVRNLWSCEACGYEFETSVHFPRRSLDMLA